MKITTLTYDEFRERFCNGCYWKKNGGCDIETVTVYCCVHENVTPNDYKIKEDK